MTRHMDRVRRYRERFYEDLARGRKVSEHDPKHLAKLVGKWRDRALAAEADGRVHRLLTKIGRLSAQRERHSRLLRTVHQDLLEGQYLRALESLRSVCPWLEEKP